MNHGLARRPVLFLAASLLQWPLTEAAPGVSTPGAAKQVELRAYVNEACIVADEPFFIADADKADADQRAKFLPLLGLVVGKLAELFINHEIQASVNGLKARAARKDTRYAAGKQMNLYRVDFAPEPAISLNARLGCMTIVAAAFAPDTTDCTASYVPKALAPESRGRPQREWKTSRTDDSLENPLRRANICVEGKARALYEARFEFSADGTAYRLKDAGYRVESLLTTQEPGATRDTIYTLKVSAPTATDQQQVLSSAWVGLGALKAGARGNGSGGNSAPWLQVPPLSPDARRLYDQKTQVHQEVLGEIEALKRALTRNERMLAGLDQRIPTASPDVAQGLRETRTKLAVQVETQRAELDARNAEYEDLPHTPMELMPVAIEVAVTETESEKKSQLALADLIGSQSGFVASTVGSATTGLFSKAVNPQDIKIDPDAGEPSVDVERARARYFDALIEVQTSPTGAASADAERELAQARDDYNGLRTSQGLEPIK